MLQSLIFMASQMSACQGFYIINFLRFYFAFNMGHNYPSGILTLVVYEAGSLISSTKIIELEDQGIYAANKLPLLRIVINEYSFLLSK